MSVSCLPHFAQPYRLANNESIEAFFLDPQCERGDVARWRDLLFSYRRRYLRWFPSLRAACGAFLGRSPPQEDAAGFWRRAMKACGGLAAATGAFVRQLAVTFFGRYRCHQRRVV